MKTSITLNLWDTGGQAYFRDLISLYYKDASAAILICDKSNRASLDNLRDWMNELDQKTEIEKMVIAVAINKCDLEEGEINIEDLEELKEITNFMTYQTSAKNGQGVHEMFQDIAKHVYQKSLQLNPQNN